MSDLAAWIQAIAAVASVAGAGIAWWMANKSGRAKDQAEAARDEAKRRLQAAEAQAAALERVAKELEGPRVSLERRSRTSFILTNRSSDPIHVVVLHPEAMYSVNPKELDLSPGEGKDMVLLGADGLPVPPTLEVEVNGHQMFIPVPRK